ncbi:MAG: GNAT family N-acetyltransferase [Rhodospirillaceae bacterium]
MPDGADGTTVTLHGSINDFAVDDWNACAGLTNPFVKHGFLSALEDSGSVCAKTGWLPRHVAIRDSDGILRACAPFYAKGHSYGEYVFDWAWAQAYERAGGDYYPKMLCAVPFTPATGPRLLVHPDAQDPGELKRAMVAGMVQAARQMSLSSVHLTFLTEEDRDAATSLPRMLQRVGQQYHWENKGYDSFQDFLDLMASRKRKTIRKEREKANGHGVVLRTLVGADIQPRHWDAFYAFYRDTSDRKWGQAYLKRDFFNLMPERCGDDVVLVVGEPEGGGDPVCGALNLQGSETLFGRNWGCDGHYGFLHFEACYYRAIDFAIETGLKRVEAGAQGDHKLSRGYEPRATWSAHWLADPGLEKAVARFLQQEEAAVCQDIEALQAYTPFRKQDP